MVASRVRHLDAIGAPHCEIGCGASIAHALGVDLRREILGAELSLELATARMSTVPQPFLARTDVILTSQGAGWRAGLYEIAAVRSVDCTSDQRSYIDQLREELVGGEVLAFVDEFHLPWMTEQGIAHGQLPHTVAIDEISVQHGTVSVIEGHSWWLGRHELSLADFVQAAFPASDVHGIAGRYIRFEAPDPAVAREVRSKRSRAALCSSCARSIAPQRVGTADRWGERVVISGPDLAGAAHTAIDTLRSLADDRLSGRDQSIGAYAIQRLVDELALTTYARGGTADLLASTAGEHQPSRQVALAWRVAWQSLRAFRDEWDERAFDQAAQQIDAAIVADLALADELAGYLADAPDLVGHGQ